MSSCRHSSNINLHRKLLTKELDDIVLDPQLMPMPRDLRAEFLAKIYGAGHHHHHLSLEALGGAAGGLLPRGLGRDDDADSPAGTEYSNSNGGYYHRHPSDDYMVLDLSTTSSVQSSGSIHSSRESDEGSDEGILLDDLEAHSDGEDCNINTEAQGQAGAEEEGGDGEGGGERGERGREEGGRVGGVGRGEVEGPLSSDPSSSPSLLASSGGSSGGGGAGILCTICHKLYSNKGTLRVHYKTVHLREMHKCKVPGCNMMFSSVRSRNRHSQNPNLHKNAPFATMID